MMKLPDIPRPVLYGLIAAIILAILFTLSRCNRDTTAERQAEQTAASGDAIANAANIAIDTLENRTATETEIDRAVAVGMMEIDNATDPDAVRNAVLDGVCGSPSHRNDPGCTMR